MSWSLIQSAVSTTATHTGSGGTLTATANFGSNTTSGNLLVLCNFTQCTGDTPTFGAISITGSGLTWNTRGAWTNSHTTSVIWKGSGVFSFVNSAASISSGTTISVSSTIGAGTLTHTDNLQFVLFEFSGNTSSATYLDGGGTNIGTSSIPDAGATGNTASNELVVTGFVGNTGSSGVPSGFSAGPSVSGISFGGVAYLLNAGLNPSVTWSSGSQGKWAAGAHTIFGATATSRTYVSTFGF
jgi:hypothetical protein